MQPAILSTTYFLHDVARSLYLPVRWRDSARQRNSRQGYLHLLLRFAVALQTFDLMLSTRIRASQAP
ncbi:hypothetical protein ASF30_20585 [Leifsonia sp. Leaf264]|nr:hypothetical protein ASF30_20585 [Leifsonia sp. Leaf264]